MNMSSESLLVILFVGLVAGWLAGQIVQGTGFGIIGDLIVGSLCLYRKLVVASARHPSWYGTGQRNRQRHHRCDIAAPHGATVSRRRRMGKQVARRMGSAMVMLPRAARPPFTIVKLIGIKWATMPVRSHPKLWQG
jgi:hypothetical protein